MTKRSLQWTDIAQVFTQAARAVQNLTEWSYAITHRLGPLERQTYDLNAQRLENLRLDGMAKIHRAQEAANKVVMTDARAELDHALQHEKIRRLELQNAELRRKLEAAGVYTPEFKAEHYAEPGDVKRGILPTNKDSNQFTR